MTGYITRDSEGIIRFGIDDFKHFSPDYIQASVDQGSILAIDPIPFDVESDLGIWIEGDDNEMRAWIASRKDPQSDPNKRCIWDNKIAMAKAREGIDVLDRRLIDILQARLGFVRRVGQIKKANGIPVRCLEREFSQMQRLAEICSSKNDPELSIFASLVIRTIIECSVRIQEHKVEVGNAIYRCPLCRVRTSGYIKDSLPWPCCPSCRLPLLVAEK